jgi:hypothetical protein
MPIFATQRYCFRLRYLTVQKTDDRLFVRFYQGILNDLAVFGKCPADGVLYATDCMFFGDERAISHVASSNPASGTWQVACVDECIHFLQSKVASLRRIRFSLDNVVPFCHSTTLFN